MANGMTPDELKAAQRMATTAGLEVIGVEPHPYRGANHGETSFAVRNPATGHKLNWTNFAAFSVWVTEYIATQRQAKRR